MTSEQDSSLPKPLVEHPHVLVALGGVPMVAGSAVPVRHLYALHARGWTVKRVVALYPFLGWAKVLDALAFAYDNQDLVEMDLRREGEDTDTARASTEGVK